MSSPETRQMSSLRPYLIRAMYEWIIDNQLTPYLLVDAAQRSGLQIPQEFIQDGTILLNIDPAACRGFHLTPESIVFSARFIHQIKQVCIPPQSVLAIYAAENERGIFFSEEWEEGEGEDGQDLLELFENRPKMVKTTPDQHLPLNQTRQRSHQKPQLRVIRNKNALDHDT